MAGSARGQVTGGPPAPVVALDGGYWRVVRDWAQLPAGMVLRGVSDVAVDEDDNICVLQRSDPPIVVFDPDGRVVSSLGSGLIVDGHSVVAAPGGRLLVVDRDYHEVLCLTLAGEVVFRLGKRCQPRLNGCFNHPTDAAIAPDGAIYVSDGYGNSAIHRFSADARWVHSWGGAGRGPGELSNPHSLCVRVDGRVVVADRENDRVVEFTPDGSFVAEHADCYRPLRVRAAADGGVYVSDHVPRLTHLSRSWCVVSRCRPVPSGAHGFSWDSRGNFYLAEPAPEDRITLLRPAA